VLSRSIPRRLNARRFFKSLEESSKHTCLLLPDRCSRSSTRHQFTSRRYSIHNNRYGTRCAGPRSNAYDRACLTIRARVTGREIARGKFRRRIRAGKSGLANLGWQIWADLAPRAVGSGTSLVGNGTLAGNGANISLVMDVTRCGKGTTSCCPESARQTTMWMVVDTLYGEGLGSR